LNHHREEPQGVERRPSFRTGYGDAAIQEIVGRPAFRWIASLPLATTMLVGPNGVEL
jgi:hypothetical protein